MHERETDHSARCSAQSFRGRALWLYGPQSISLVGSEQRPPIIARFPRPGKQAYGKPRWSVCSENYTTAKAHTLREVLLCLSRNTNAHILSSAYVFCFKLPKDPTKYITARTLSGRGPAVLTSYCCLVECLLLSAAWPKPHPVPRCPPWSARKAQA